MKVLAELLVCLGNKISMHLNLTYPISILMLFSGGKAPDDGAYTCDVNAPSTALLALHPSLWQENRF